MERRSPEELRLDKGGALIAARHWHARENAPRVLALHGWLDNGASFDALAPFIPEVELVAVDLPGHGRSDHRPAGDSYHFIDYVKDVMRIVDELGWEACELLGHSMGAAVAAMAAGAFPERFVKLAAIEGLAPLTAEEVDAPGELAEHIKQARALDSKRFPVYKSVDEALAARRNSGDYVEGGGIRAVVERGLKSLDGRFQWSSDARLRVRSPLRLSVAQAQAFLARITCPVLLVRARQGLPYDERSWRHFLAAVPDLSVEEIDGHHHVHLDDPEGVAKLLKPFLSV